MDSAEANVVLNEIIDALGDSTSDRPVIEVQDRVANGYAVCIKTFLGAAKKQAIDTVAANHKLTLSEESDGLVLC